MKGPPDIAVPHGRLQWARERAGYETTAAFAREHQQDGLIEPTYRAHENGTNGLSRHVAEKYGRWLKVSPGWLLTGEKGLQGSDAVDIDTVDPPPFESFQEIVDKDMFWVLLQEIYDLHQREGAPLPLGELGRMATAEYRDMVDVSDQANTHKDMIKLFIKKQRRRIRAEREVSMRSA